MAILALLIGLVAGAAGVYPVASAGRSSTAIGPADAREAQRALAETEGALPPSGAPSTHGSRPRSRPCRRKLLRENANTFTEQAMGRSVSTSSR